MRLVYSQFPRLFMTERKVTRRALIAGALVLVVAGVLAGRSVAAQNIGQRVVSGFVVNEAGAVQVGATVFLKNLKTKAIRSYTTAADGKFHFTQANMSEDHEVWAELNGKKSAVKTVSSWDARKLFECELKLK